jgi:uncharacterized protein with HEPN domain
MKRSHRFRLDDIIEAIDGIIATAEGLTYDDYFDSWQAQRAVERGVEIISEATRHLPGPWLAKYPEIPWPEIKSIGNRLRHEYRRVDPMIMWGIATSSVQQLRPMIVDMDRLADDEEAR